jgi:hypothetical protein
MKNPFNIPQFEVSHTLMFNSDDSKSKNSELNYLHLQFSLI